MPKKSPNGLYVTDDASAGGQPLELVGTWEAAEILGVERPRLGRWLNPWREWVENGRRGSEPDLRIPKPVADLRSGPVWLRSEIQEFAKQRRADAKASASA